MADTELDELLPKILPLVRMLASDNEHEAFAALRALIQTLYGAGFDIHALAERLEIAPVSDEDMQRVFDKGVEYGRSEAIEQQHRTVATTPKSFFGGPSAVSPGGYINDHDRIAGQDVRGNYQWHEIATHCANNLNRIPDKHHGFLEDMAVKLNGSVTVSGAQAKYLASLFTRYLNGRI